MDSWILAIVALLAINLLILKEMKFNKKTKLILTIIIVIVCYSSNLIININNTSFAQEIPLDKDYLN